MIGGNPASSVVVVDVNTITAVTPPGTAGTVQSMTISNLTPGQFYYIGIKASSTGRPDAALSNISSAIARFSPGTGQEDPVTQLSPQSGGIVTSSHPSLIVSNASGENNVYYFEVSTNSNFTVQIASSGAVAQAEGTTTSKY